MNAEEVHKHGEKVLNDFGKTLWSRADRGIKYLAEFFAAWYDKEKRGVK